MGRKWLSINHCVHSKHIQKISSTISPRDTSCTYSSCSNTFDSMHTAMLYQLSHLTSHSGGKCVTIPTEPIESGGSHRSEFSWVYWPSNDVCVWTAGVDGDDTDLLVFVMTQIFLFL